jgi:chromosome-anchoring protein RacA
LNSSNAANLLGVSQSTIQRWIKQLDLDMNRNDLGHFHFNEKDISVLKLIQEQIHNGVLLQDVVVTSKKVRKGKIALSKNDPVTETLLNKVNDLERRLNEKADKVVSYQLLTHRKELEDLENEVMRLNMRVELLENKLLEKKKDKSPDNLLLIDQMKVEKRAKKKNILTILFGL